MPDSAACFSWACSRVALPVLCGVLSLGCGSGGSSDTAHWQGNVTVAGSPAPAEAVGSITFRPQGDKAKPVTVPIENGQYDSPATPKGKVIAYIDLQVPTGESTFSERMGKDIPVLKDLVPPEKTRGIEFDVSGDRSDAHIEL